MARALRVDKLTLAALEATLTGPLPPVAARWPPTRPPSFDRAERTVARLAEAGLDARVVAARPRWAAAAHRAWSCPAPR